MRRLLLLLPMPVIAGWVAYSGFVYIPDELQLNLSAKPSTLIRMPQEAAGFSRSGAVRAYNRDSLYEYVNGHAEFFISSGFVSLTVADYSAGGGKGEITVELYDMQNPRNVRGVLSAEKGNGKPVGSVGFGAYSQKGSFIFGKGRYYVRLGLFNIEDSSLTMSLAKNFDAMIKGKAENVAKPLLPPGGMLEGSAGFVKSDYMGLSFLSDISTVRYAFDGGEFDAFEFQKPPDAVIKFYEGEKATLKDFQFEGFKRIVIEDKYEGFIHLITDGRVSIGIKGEVPPKFLESFMHEAVSNFKGDKG